MPNWCDCDLTIKGKQNFLRDFRDRARSVRTKEPDVSKDVVSATLTLLEDKNHRIDELSSDVFVPMPLDFQGQDAYNGKRIKKTEAQLMQEYGVTNGYDWCLKNWGSKWGICESTPGALGPRTLKYNFQSPWSPPEKLIQAMSAQHPELHFTLKFYEAGNGFKGVSEFSKGKRTREETYDYSGSRGG
jgi:hypothetical protein